MLFKQEDVFIYTIKLEINNLQKQQQQTKDTVVIK